MSPRHAALAAVLLIAGIATLLLSLPHPAPALPPPAVSSTAVTFRTYLIDVAGWYQITPDESAVVSLIDLSLDGLKTLPTAIGGWTGSPYTLDAAVGDWFQDPDVALSSLYRDDRGRELWLSVFGSRGLKSYVLFEHTPITSYPAAGWRVLENGVVPVSSGTHKMSVQRALLTRDAERRVVLYWYLWSDFNRDPEQGILAVRLHLPVLTTDQDALEAGADFLRSLFPQVISWHRF